EGQNDRLPALAAELVRRQVTVIVSTSTPAVLAARTATTTIPIVFFVAADPVQLGLVTSLSRPGGNLTGVVTLNVEVAAKRLELLHELVPTATIVALLVNPTSSALAETTTRELEAAARTLGLELHACEQRTRNRCGIRHLDSIAGRRTCDRRRCIVQQPQRTARRTDDPPPGARDLPVSRVCIHWWPDGLRQHRFGYVPPTRSLYRPNSQRREACRAAGPAGDQSGARHQLENRQGARPHRPAADDWPRRRGDRIRTRGSHA